MADDLYSKIVGQQGSFEKLLSRIPGFRGYLDRATRRTADRMLRDYLAGRLAQRLRRMADIERRILDLEGGLHFMSKTSRVRSQLQLYRDKVNAAMPGYSGFMDAIKVDAAELESLYNFDEAQLRYLDQFDSALDALDNAVKAQAGQATSGQPLSIDDALAGIEAIAMEALDAFLLRENVLDNLSKQHGN